MLLLRQLLEKKTEGWVTGLRLAGHYLRDNEDLSQRMKDISGNSKHITEYLVSEVLAKQDPQIITYLLETSLLDRFCVPLCQAVHGRGIKNPKALPDLDAEVFIQWLVKSNLFVTPLDDQGYWFRYHYLFQEFLQIKLRKEVDANTINVLHMQASKWFAENGLIEEALQNALAAGNNQVAARLVAEYRYDLMNNAQYQRLNKWLALLPKDTVAESLPLVTARAITAWVSGRTGDVATYTKQARRLLEALSPEFFEYGIFQGEILTLESVVNALAGQPVSFVDSQKAMELLPKEALFFRATAVVAMALSCQMKGDLEQGLSLLRDVLKAADLPISIQARVWFYLCFINYVDCNTPGIMLSGHKVLEIAKTSQLAHTTGVSKYLIGATHYLRNELKEAKTYLLSVIDDHAFTNAIYVTQACSVLGFIYLAEGFPEKAESVVAQAVDNAWEMQDQYSPSVRKALRVELALRRGMVDEARRLSIGVDFNIIPPSWRIYIPQLTHIKLLLAESTDEGLNQAHNRLVELGTKMRRINRKCVLIDVLALDALVCRKLGKQKIALERLQEALALAEPGGWIRNFVDLGITMRDLLERLNQVYPGQKFTQQILDACRAEDKVNVLTKREIEILALLVDGCNNKEIAARLFIAQETVKTHLQNIYSKLDVRGRLKVIKKARSLGFIPQN